MALIICPSCGKEISDKANKCVHCGNVLREGEMVQNDFVCKECGAHLVEGDEICSSCGCPVESIKNESFEKPQQVEVTNIKMTVKTKRIFIISIIVVLLLGGGLLGLKLFSDVRAKQNYQNEFNDYIVNLEKVQTLMLAGGSEAESMCNLTLRVWGNAISKEWDDETDKYTRGRNGWNDFNDALANLYEDSITTVTIRTIESNQTAVKELMKELQNPPEGLENCYNTITDLYESYKKLTDMAKSPSGSYRDYGTNKNSVVSDFMAEYERLDNQIPDKFVVE